MKILRLHFHPQAGFGATSHAGYDIQRVPGGYVLLTDPKAFISDALAWCDFEGEWEDPLAELLHILTAAQITSRAVSLLATDVSTMAEELVESPADKVLEETAPPRSSKAKRLEVQRRK